MLLLTDFFEKFRATCLAHYSLDAVHYYTVPVLAWDVALRMTDVPLELITDIDMCQFTEKSIRGGISMITTRYARANAPTSIWMRITSMDGQCLNHCPPACFDSSNRMRLRHWRRWGSYPTMLKMDIYLRWIAAIYNIYTTLVTTTHSPPSRWRFIVICIHPLSRQSFHRLHIKGNSLLI